MSYDPKSEELAQYFLDGWTHKPEDVASLAHEIQSAVEDWFSDHEDRVKEIHP